MGKAVGFDFSLLWIDHCRRHCLLKAIEIMCFKKTLLKLSSSNKDGKPKRPGDWADDRNEGVKPLGVAPVTAGTPAPPTGIKDQRVLLRSMRTASKTWHFL